MDTEPVCLADLRRHLGHAIRSHRHAAGWTQERLAEAAGLSPEHVCRLERGLATPSLRTLCAIAESLTVPVTSFFCDHKVPCGPMPLPDPGRDRGGASPEEIIGFVEALAQLLRDSAGPNGR